MTAAEIHGLVGESGCGKTVTSTAIMGLLPVPPARIEGGSIVFEGRDLLGLSAEERRKVRGRQIAMVFQEPARYLNPSLAGRRADHRDAGPAPRHGPGARLPSGPRSWPVSWVSAARDGCCTPTPTSCRGA